MYADSVTNEYRIDVFIFRLHISTNRVLPESKTGIDCDQIADQTRGPDPFFSICV